MKSVGIFEAKTHFTAICDEVVRTGQPTLVSKRGKPLVLLTPAPDGPDSGGEGILAAWSRWEKEHPPLDDEPDFTDLRQLRSGSKPNPLAES